ncbi:unnamed protein product [Taenia asiatica]|uniref:Cytoskeleton-associated protein 4 n=1 Tax=Taenia asiatica TaxID=60517 RepID=A0A0R3W9F0_TAEAS|nr:unnamed protein product [Taenia asiatica]
MQRTPRQGTLVVSKDKGQTWSNTVSSSTSFPTHRPANMADLESRVAAAERSNQKILHDIADLKEELQLGRKRTVGRSIGDLPGQTNTDQVLQKLSADIQTVNSRCGSQALDIQNLYQELKNFESKLENTLHNDLRYLPAEISGNFVRPESNSTKKSNVSNVRGSSSVDRAVQRLEAAVAQIERKMDSIQSDRLRFENAIQNNLIDQATRSSESGKSTEEMMVELRSMLRSNAQEIVSSRQNVRSEMEDLSEKLNKRVTDALEKLQDELNSSHTDLEAALGRFSLANSAYETRLVEVESGLKKLAKELPGELNELRQEHQTNQRKLLNTLTQLDLAVEVLEQGLSDEKEQLKGVVAAEIKARTSNIFTIQNKLQELEESTKEASLKLNSSVDEIQERLAQLTSQVG